MQSKPGSFCWWPALFLVLVTLQRPVLAEAPSNYGSDIARLYQISQRLEVLNGKLVRDLLECQTNLKAARWQLATSGLELQTLSQQLKESKERIELLERSNQTSRDELIALLILQRKAENSLASLEGSLEAYRKKAEAEIKKLKGIAIACSVGALLVGGFCGYALRGNVR